MPVERRPSAAPRLRDRRGVVRATRPVEPQRWYAIHTKPKQEDRADANLRHWGLDTLTPRVADPWRDVSSHKAVDRVRPLFPGYLFARFDATALLHKVRLTRGVHSVVGFGELATPIDDEIIEFIRSRLSEDGCALLDAFQPGDAVEIVDGPMRSVVGVFQRDLGDQDRVVILLTAIGTCARVNVAKALVRKASSLQHLL
jgi:transcriptional antiterminator RfaH